MRHAGLTLIFAMLLLTDLTGQFTPAGQTGLVFHGIVVDAASMQPLPDSRIIVNRSVRAVSESDGTFIFSVSRRDTVEFTHLGYKPSLYFVSDTLSGLEFAAGVYLTTDTIAIEEVIIVPRVSDLKYDLLNAPVETSPQLENARYNVAVAAYGGKVTTGQLGDPLSNYGVIHQKNRINAYEKGGIPSDRIVGFSPLMLISAAYLLMNGLPPKPAPMRSTLTKKEIDQLHKKYLETSGRK